MITINFPLDTTIEESSAYFIYMNTSINKYILKIANIFFLLYL